MQEDSAKTAAALHGRGCDSDATISSKRFLQAGVSVTMKCMNAHSYCNTVAVVRLLSTTTSARRGRPDSR